jgi:hypothetical protein
MSVVDVKMEVYNLLPLPPPIWKSNDRKDIRLVEYKRKLLVTFIDAKNDFMKLWVNENYNIKIKKKRHSINIEVLIRKEPNVSPFVFFNVDIMLMREYFSKLMFFNFKTKSIDMLRLEKGLLHACFPF